MPGGNRFLLLAAGRLGGSGPCVAVCPAANRTEVTSEGLVLSTIVVKGGGVHDSLVDLGFALGRCAPPLRLRTLGGAFWAVVHVWPCVLLPAGLSG